MDDDFTIKKYELLCKSLLKGYLPLTVHEYLSQQNNKERIVIVRHDVDRFVKNALNIAKIEESLGIRATYYFRYPFTFNREIMDKIADMGHEIGYHYECLAKTSGDYDKAIRVFADELRIFREAGYSVHTVCPHGGSLSHSSTELGLRFDFSEYGIVGEAYSSLEEDRNLAYFSDTGRTWGGATGKSSLNMPSRDLTGTNDLINIIENIEYENLYVLIHPERWASNTYERARSRIYDYVFNSGKRINILLGRQSW